jgi:hypothetical protein
MTIMHIIHQTIFWGDLLKLRSLVVFWLLALVSTVCPQSKRPIYSISGGIALPSQPAVLNENWNGGWHIGGGIGYPVTRCLTIGGAFSYSHLPFDAEAVVARGSNRPWMRVEGTSSTIITGNCRAKINLVPLTRITWFSPYFFGGLGWFRLTRGEFTIRYKFVSEESMRTEYHFQVPTCQAGGEFGAGLEIYLANRLSGFAEMTYSASLINAPIWCEWIPLRVGLILH